MADGGFAAERRRLQRISLDSCGAALHAPVLGSDAGSVMLRADGGGLTQTYLVQTRHYSGVLDALKISKEK